MEHKDLTVLVSGFRKAVEKCDPSKFPAPISPNRFPKGVCGDVSYALAYYLKEQGYDFADYVCGGRSNHSHAWIELGGIIIDITADQFDDNNESVIVCKFSPWHNTFSVLYKHKLNFSAYEGFSRFSVFYDGILEHLR